MLEFLRSRRAGLHPHVPAPGMKWSIAELKRHYCRTWHHVYRAAPPAASEMEDADRLWMSFTVRIT